MYRVSPRSCAMSASPFLSGLLLTVNNPKLEEERTGKFMLVQLTFLSGCSHNLFVQLLMPLGLSSWLCRKLSAQRNRRSHDYHLHKITCSYVTWQQPWGHTVTWYGHKSAEWFRRLEGTIWILWNDSMVIKGYALIESSRGRCNFGRCGLM